MNRKFFSIMCVFCFTAMSLAFSQVNANIATTQNVQTIEMGAFEVVKIHLFEDSDEGAFFTLDDGSEWLRTWWEGPVYYLDVGQTIAIIPMTDKEAIDHQRGWYKDYSPFWIILNPKEDRSTVGMAFKMR